MTTAAAKPSPTIGPLADAASPLSKDQCFRLWCRMVDRLHQGESLFTVGHYLQAMEEEYYAMTQTPPTTPVRTYMHTMITLVNQRHPRTYMATGLHNCLSKAFEKNVERLNWALVDVQTRGTKTLKKFLQSNLRELFVDMGNCAQMVDPTLCVRSVATKMASVEEHHHRVEPMPQISLAPAAPQPPTPAAPPKENATPEVREALEDGLLNPAEVEDWTADQHRLHAGIARAELDKIPSYADSYVERGLLTKVEASNLVKLYSDDERKNKNADDVQHRLQSKLKPALDYATLYLEVFQALQRIPPARDGALTFLIRHKELVINPSADADFSEVSDALAKDADLVEHIDDLMDRQDQEVRMIHAKLPPYGQVLKRNEKVTNLVIDESFIGDLRTKDGDELSQTLNEPDTETRIRPAADMKCLISLLDQLSAPSRFAQEVRIAKANREIEQLYRSTKDKAKARDKVEHFLKRKLGYMFPDLRPFEKDRIERFGKDLLDKRKKAKPKPQPTEDGELSAAEIERGVQLTRVEVRIAGRNKRVPYKIMEDPEESGKHIILKRDPATGQLVPAVSRGKKRYVEKDKEGFWKAV